VEPHGTRVWWGYLFEEFARIRVEVESGSEFRYRKPIIYNEDVVIAISQSGETADTLAAIRLAKEVAHLFWEFAMW
jgi:glucosamine--fructose-6-phosphate aminotransferase (isomerizing)